VRTYTKAGFVVALLSISVLGACSSDSSSEDKKVDTQSVTTDVVDSSSSDASEMNEAGQEIVLIDVRTMEEFAEGHLEGALNLNVEDGTLEAALAGLDPDASYQVYCRSGRRSAIAYDLMKANGFEDVADLGSVEEAAATTGLPVIS
jgi:rhodanese-related sulfurtransferase